jgi:hypothetical protein
MIQPPKLICRPGAHGKQDSLIKLEEDQELKFFIFDSLPQDVPFPQILYPPAPESKGRDQFTGGQLAGSIRQRPTAP